MSIAKRWCFTINNPTPDDCFWVDELNPNVTYLIVQEERGEEGTLHWQGFLILNKREKMSWLKTNLNPRAHWEVTRGTNQQAADYCRKEDSYTGGLRFEHGALPQRAEAPKRQAMLQDAIETIDELKEMYIPPRKIATTALLCPSFIQAYKHITADILGPYRPELKIVTMVAPPGTGKSYSIQERFPEHGICIAGNSGVWFQNPTAEVMVFEEFNGQIPLTRMLRFLDTYPLALEVKGSMAPAMYRVVIITSNTSPKYWYTHNGLDDLTPDKRLDAIHALWDRIGYTDGGSYELHRDCGIYLEGPPLNQFIGQPAMAYVNACRNYFHDELHRIFP